MPIINIFFFILYKYINIKQNILMIGILMIHVKYGKIKIAVNGWIWIVFKFTYTANSQLFSAKKL